MMLFTKLFYIILYNFVCVCVCNIYFYLKNININAFLRIFIDPSCAPNLRSTP